MSAKPIRSKRSLDENLSSPIMKRQKKEVNFGVDILQPESIPVAAEKLADKSKPTLIERSKIVTKTKKKKSLTKKNIQPTDDNLTNQERSSSFIANVEPVQGSVVISSLNTDKLKPRKVKKKKKLGHELNSDESTKAPIPSASTDDSADMGNSNSSNTEPAEKKVKVKKEKTHRIELKSTESINKQNPSALPDRQPAGGTAVQQHKFKVKDIIRDKELIKISEDELRIKTKAWQEAGKINRRVANFIFYRRRNLLKNPKIEEEILERKNNHLVCFLCRETGHSFAQCPKSEGDVDAVAGSFCFKCGESGHISRACKIKGKDFPFAKCFVCNESGHISRQCPKNPNGAYPQGGCCHLCGKLDHLKQDCPRILPDVVKDGPGEFTLQSMKSDTNVDVDEPVTPRVQRIKKKPKTPKVVSI